jgi:hypothetical protein
MSIIPAVMMQSLADEHRKSLLADADRRRGHGVADPVPRALSLPSRQRTPWPRWARRPRQGQAMSCAE